MTYVLAGLGAAAATSSVSFVLTPTLERDGWSSLLAAYKSAFPAGTSEEAFARAVTKANGIAYTVPAIE
mgnify:CR=1 FL=1